MRSGRNNANYRHGLLYGGRHPLYTSWQNMKARCTNSNHPKYPRYGGRGVKICKEWLPNVENFYKWAISSGWEKGLTLDRIDNDGNYEPENCHWISQKLNSRKKSTTKLTIQQAGEIRNRLTNGENAYDLADKYGVVHGTIWFIENNITHLED